MALKLPIRKTLQFNETLTTIPGIGFIYANRLQAAGFEKVGGLYITNCASLNLYMKVSENLFIHVQTSDLLHKFNQYNGDPKRFEQWLRISCRAYSHHAEKCCAELVKLKRDATVKSLSTESSAHNISIWFFKLQMFDNISYSSLSFAHRSPANWRHDGGNMLNRITIDKELGALIETEPNLIAPSENVLNTDEQDENMSSSVAILPAVVQFPNSTRISGNQSKHDIIDELDTSTIDQLTNEFQAKFNVAINDVNKKLHELQCDLDNLHKLHSEFRKKYREQLLKQEQTYIPGQRTIKSGNSNDIQSINHKIKKIDHILNAMAHSLDNVANGHVKLDTMLQQSNEKLIRLSAFIQCSLSPNLSYLNINARKMNDTFKHIVDTNRRFEMDIRRELSRNSDRFDNIIDEKLGHFVEQIKMEQDRTARKLLAVTLAVGLIFINFIEYFRK